MNIINWTKGHIFCHLISILLNSIYSFNNLLIYIETTETKSINTTRNKSKHQVIYLSLETSLKCLKPSN